MEALIEGYFLCGVTDKASTQRALTKYVRDTVEGMALGVAYL